TRVVLDRVLPDPGEGPDEKARERGFFKIDTHARTSTGAHLVCRIAAPGDPGYKATAVMLGEAALALALDGERLPDAVGVLTPAYRTPAPFAGTALFALGATMSLLPVLS